MKLLFVIFLAFSFSAARAETKIAIVNMEKAIQSTATGKKAKADLEGEFERKKKEFQKEEADLKKNGEELEKKKSVMSEEALMKKQGEFQESVMKYREKVQKSQIDIHKKQSELTKPIVEKMQKVIVKVAKEKGYTLVLENSPMILYAEKSDDLTDEVIKAFENEK